MKRIFTIAAALLMTASVWAQSPEKMSYQAVVRDAGNALVSSTAVGMQISILQTTATGTAVYVETQTPTTNINGLVSIEIGSGTVISGTFNTIDWSTGPYFIKTETDPTGGTTYTITGTSQLMSVPYALHANTADSIAGGVSITETDPVFGASIANGITALDTASWNNHTIDTDTQLDSTGIAALGYVAGGITTEVDSSVTNEIQTISRTGTTVMLSNGGGTFEDSVGVYTPGTGIDITDNVISTSDICGLSIGDTYQGGIIFYLDASGCHGLISAATDQSNGVRWYAGTYGDTRATGDGLYAGEANTKIIIASQVAIGDDGGSYAAQICSDLQITEGSITYGDWYLPSIHELTLMYKNIGQGNTLGLGNIGNFAESSYWSSTEWSHNFAFQRNFSINSSYSTYENSIFYVRAIRTF
jgi:hypothetical protein